MSNHTPTPVPSEVAETTAGEREVENDLHPAEPDAGTVEALIVLIEEHTDVAGWEAAHAILASDWLAARDDRVRREEGERVLASAAFDIAHTKGGEILGRYDAMRWLRARAASVGRGEGL